MSPTVHVFEEMLGATMQRVEGCAAGSERMTLVDSFDGGQFVFRHNQDCCENVEIVDVTGDPADLIGSPLLVAEEVSSEGAESPENEYESSYTWTFYKFATIKGAVTVRWLGTSNGFYSESVDYRPPPACKVHSDCLEHPWIARACAARKGEEP